MDGRMMMSRHRSMNRPKKPQKGRKRNFTNMVDYIKLKKVRVEDKEVVNSPIDAISPPRVIDVGVIQHPQRSDSGNTLIYEPLDSALSDSATSATSATRTTSSPINISQPNSPHSDGKLNEKKTPIGRSLSVREINYGSPDKRSFLKQRIEATIEGKQSSEHNMWLNFNKLNDFSLDESESLCSDKSSEISSPILSPRFIKSPRSIESELTSPRKAKEVWESIVFSDESLVIVQYRCDHLTGKYIKGFLQEIPLSRGGIERYKKRYKCFQKKSYNLTVISPNIMDMTSRLVIWFATHKCNASELVQSIRSYDIFSYASAILGTDRIILEAEYENPIPGSSMFDYIDPYPAYSSQDRANKQAQLFCNLHAKIHGYKQPFTYAN